MYKNTPGVNLYIFGVWHGEWTRDADLRRIVWRFRIAAALLLECSAGRRPLLP